MREVSNLILGAGISGVSASYHLGHENCLILEKSNYSFGLLHSNRNRGFTWDQGPHVSFTKHQYVKELFAANVNDDYFEHIVSPISYFGGDWLDHPIQSNLYQLEPELNSKCVQSFLACRNRSNDLKIVPADYRAWSESALGLEITNTFVAPYTRKYWTTEPEQLTIDWVGPRVFKPDINDILAGSKKKPEKNSHYISSIRYPKRGGYQAFVDPLALNANIELEHEVCHIDLQNKVVSCRNGERYKYDKLVSSLPLPLFVKMIDSLDSKVYEAAGDLSCTELLLINVEVPEEISFKEHWLYVYDEDKYSTRITLMENLSENNTRRGSSGLQVEVYFSKYRPINESVDYIARTVVSELIEMKLVSDKIPVSKLKWHTRWIQYANVIFDHKRATALDTIFCALEHHGLQRSDDDLNALTNWSENIERRQGDVSLIGRFGEWKYYWSDDCVLSGKSLANGSQKLE